MESAIESAEKYKIKLKEDESITLIVFGASGALANDKVIPAVFDLHKFGLLPERFRLVGYARSDLDKKGFISRFRDKLDTDHIADKRQQLVDQFTDMCHYVRGQYDQEEAFKNLQEQLSKTVEAEMERQQRGAGTTHNRVFYLAIPPQMFLVAAQHISRYCRPEKGWIRVMVEKPFGTDLHSFDRLSRGLQECYNEDEEVYRVDHFLGKQVVQDILTLRFGNAVWQPLWNGEHISSMHIMLRETGGVAGRGEYFDEHGIIRDVVQNHLTQVLALLTMEEPTSLNRDDVQARKAEILRTFKIDERNDVVIGQYGRPSEETRETAEVKEGYLDDETVPDDSIASTYFGAVLCSERTHWSGVPIFLEAGKGLRDYESEIRVRFRRPRSVERLFRDEASSSPGGGGESGVEVDNELVISIDPQQRVSLRLNNRAPGLQRKVKFVNVDLEFNYKSKFDRPGLIPKAYARLLVEAMQGDMRNSVGSDQLRAQWELWDRTVHHIEENHIKPEIYPSGSKGPEEGRTRLATKYCCEHWLK